MSTSPDVVLPDGLELELLTPPAEGAAPSARLTGWWEAHARGFHQARVGDGTRAMWLDHLRADVVGRGVWEQRPALGAGTIPVATYSSFDKTLNTGAGLVPLRMITDITVAPTHRRRGLLRTLITDDLRDAAAAGVPVAALTVSEGTIYGRFGFGPAAWSHRLEVDTSSRFALRPPEGPSGDPQQPGQVVMLEPAEAWPAVHEVFTRWHAATRGSVERPRFYESMLSGAHDFDSGGPDHRLRVAVHLGADGRPDGHVAYRAEGDSGPRTLVVDDLLSLDATAHRALWRFLADVDLAGTVKIGNASVADPLPWMLTDPRVVTTTGGRDSVWVRLLDVPAALRARPWYADGEVVLASTDPLGMASGTWRVVVRDGAAEVEATDAEPDVRLAAEVLGSLYLGGVTLGELDAAGRVAGSPDAVRTLAAMVDGGPPPHCVTGF